MYASNMNGCQQEVGKQPDLEVGIQKNLSKSCSDFNFINTMRIRQAQNTQDLLHLPQ